MKVSKTKNRFKTGFQQPKTGLQKNGFNIPSNNTKSKTVQDWEKQAKW